ncbi:hypothetical protein LTR17_004750 [Elasticomyces elasticus]|nr:hypothetical protein LTR17_004750 [Elasticomyces elasticus]
MVNALDTTKPNAMASPDEVDLIEFLDSDEDEISKIMINPVDAVTRTQTRADVQPEEFADAFTALYLVYFEQRRLGWAKIYCMHGEVELNDEMSMVQTDPVKVQASFEMAGDSDIPNTKVKLYTELMTVDGNFLMLTMPQELRVHPC